MSRPHRVPPLGYALPRSGGPISRAAGRWALALVGWRIEGELPDVPRAVIIIAPHTSNWDFVVAIAAKLGLGLRAAWLGKDSLFHPPLGGLMRRLGGIPVDRARPHDVVAASVARFAATERLVLGLAPEGTRKSVGRWRTGFYHIARGAGVPIVPVAVDWSRRALAIGPSLVPGNDMGADLAALGAFFAPARGRRGERPTPPQ
jgi:1-acyl-sn-glycerol-3-phosphate acyltransferase